MAPGVLFRGGVEGEIRERLVKERYIETVIALPHNMFHGTGIAAYILSLKGGRTESDILFIDGTLDAKIIGGRNVFDTLAIQKIVDKCNLRISEIGKSRLVTFDEVRANAFNLEISRYVPKEIEKEHVSLAELVEKQITLESQLLILQNYMHRYF